MERILRKRTNQKYRYTLYKIPLKEDNFSTKDDMLINPKHVQVSLYHKEFSFKALFYQKVVTHVYILSISNCRHIWQAYTDSGNPTETSIKTSVLLYRDMPVISFDILYLSGLSSDPSNETEVKVVSSFPSFVYEERELERGWMTWSGNSKFAKT